MQPKEHEYPIDYLEEISTAPKKSKLPSSDKIFFAIIALILVVITTIGVVAFLNTRVSDSDNIVKIDARINNLQSIVGDSQKTITSSSLRGINANLNLVLAEMERGVSQQIESHEIVMAEVDPALAAGEELSSLSIRLEEARINATFDRIYAREMSYELISLTTLLEQTRSQSSSQALIDFTIEVEQKISPLQEQFSSFNIATS